MQKQSVNSLPPNVLRSRRTGVVLAIGILLFLMAVAAGCIYCAVLCTGSWLQRLPFLVLAAAALFLPSWALFIAVRRKLTTGQWRISEEERGRLRAKSIAHSESPLTKTLTSPWMDFSTALLMLCPAVIIIGKDMRRGHLVPFDLAVSAIWVFSACIWLWNGNRKLKAAQPAQ